MKFLDIAVGGFGLAVEVFEVAMARVGHWNRSVHGSATWRWRMIRGPQMNTKARRLFIARAS
jgi:hypothetical protein